MKNMYYVNAITVYQHSFRKMNLWWRMLWRSLVHYLNCNMCYHNGSKEDYHYLKEVSSNDAQSTTRTSERKSKITLLFHIMNRRLSCYLGMRPNQKYFWVQQIKITIETFRNNHHKVFLGKCATRCRDDPNISRGNSLVHENVIVYMLYS